jgi:hypothetical protein
VDLLMITAYVLVRTSGEEWGYRTTECDFEIAIEGGGFAAMERRGVSGLSVLPKQPRPLKLSLRVKPKSASRWPVRANFEFQEPGHLTKAISFKADDPELEGPAFEEPSSFLLEAGLPPFVRERSSVTSVSVHVSRVRDVTQKVLEGINHNIPASMQKFFKDNWLPEWPSPPVENLHFSTDRGVDDNRELDFEQAQITTPDSIDRVFEVADVDAPKLIGMWLPRSLPMQRFGSRPMPFLIYFHPTIGQAVDDYAPFPYPFGWPFLYFILRRDANYFLDPLTQEPGLKGLNYQRAHSGKEVALLVPVNRLSKEVGVFLNAEDAESLIREIQGFMQRRSSNYEVPAPGHVALSAFSAGCGILINSLLGKSQDHPFTKKILKEIYLLDPRMNSEALVGQVLKWANADPGNKRLRVYLSTPDANYLKVIGAQSFPPTPFARSTPDGLRTLVVTTIPDWPKAAKKRGAANDIIDRENRFGPVHELHPGMFVTHALRHSGFQDTRP